MPLIFIYIDHDVNSEYLTIIYSYIEEQLITVAARSKA
jgi:hypothetical protein